MAKSAKRSIPVLTMLVLVISLAGAIWAPSAGAQGTCEEKGCVDVVAVDGLIDEIEADNIIATLRAADSTPGLDALVFQLDSPGSAVDDERLAEVARAMVDATVPVTVWVGPSGAVALGGAAELAGVADFTGIAPGAEIGEVGAPRLPAEEFGEPFEGVDGIATSRLSGREAVDAGAADVFAPIVREHIVNIDGVEVEITREDGERSASPVALVRFSKLPLGTQFMHTVASPSVAYLLVVAGLGLLLFEFFTAGIGIAGVVGAGCAVLAAYGIAELPHNGWALGLVVLSFLAFAVDVQSGVPRAWTVIGMVMFAVGSLFLFTEFRPTWLALAAGLVGIAVTMFSGMPAMVRTRFGTPTIGRDWMVGQQGEAVTDVDPDGTVRIRGALWRARTNRATPVAAGETVRVVEIDGLLLEVEPPEGGAVDYREMRDRRK